MKYWEARSVAEAKSLTKESVRYCMFRLLLDSDEHADTIRARIGLSKRKMNNMFTTDYDLSMRDISDWCFAFGAVPKWEIRPKRA